MDYQPISQGDTVRVQFWPNVDDVVGVVMYYPSEPGDCWTIQENITGKIVCVMHYARMTRISEVANA